MQQYQQTPYGMMHYQHQNLMTQQQTQWAAHQHQQQQQRNYAARQVVDSRVPAPAPPRTETSATTKKKQFVDSEFPPLS